MNVIQSDIIQYWIHITGELDHGQSYDWITDRVAIGDCTSSYQAFDVVVNLNFPNNCAEYQTIGSVREGKLTIYGIGLKDEEYEAESLSRFLDHLLPALSVTFMEKPETRFLFHCRAGISRSVSMAIAFMMETTHDSLYDVVDQIQRIRPIALPNVGFMSHLMERYLV